MILYTITWPVHIWRRNGESQRSAWVFCVLCCELCSCPNGLPKHNLPENLFEFANIFLNPQNSFIYLFCSPFSNSFRMVSQTPRWCKIICIHVKWSVDEKWNFSNVFHFTCEKVPAKRNNFPAINWNKREYLLEFTRFPFHWWHFSVVFVNLPCRWHFVNVKNGYQIRFLHSNECATHEIQLNCSWWKFFMW